MQAGEIKRYLYQMGLELQERCVEKVHILLIGGAYKTVFVNPSRRADDVDFFWLEEDEQTLEAWHEGVQAVATRNGLEMDWLNYMTYLLLSGEVIVPKGRLWKKFGPLHIHIPPTEYVLVLKIIAGRPKDIADSCVLLKRTKIRTREQAQTLLNCYISPRTQHIFADSIQQSLEKLFGEVEGT